jgi:hypothetical protein
VVSVTWQANGEYPLERNHVAGILLGSGVPDHYKGTKDSNIYSHYSEISTVEANWDLHTLGRWDVGANVFRFVGSKTADVIRRWNTNIAGDSFGHYRWNQSYGGVFSSAKSTSHEYVKPKLNLVHNGRTVLPAIKGEWLGSTLPSYYRDIIELPDAYHPPSKAYGVPVPLHPAPPIQTPIRVYPVKSRSDTDAPPPAAATA